MLKMTKKMMDKKKMSLMRDLQDYEDVVTFILYYVDEVDQS